MKTTTSNIKGLSETEVIALRKKPANNCVEHKKINDGITKQFLAL